MSSNLDIWENIFKENQWGKYPFVPVIRFIAKNFYKVNNRNKIKILEIGSGTGANLQFCAREGFSVYGIEGSATAVERMRQRFFDENLVERIGMVEIGDYYDKLDNFKDEYFDAIIDSESLYCNDFEKVNR